MHYKVGDLVRFIDKEYSPWASMYPEFGHVYKVESISQGFQGIVLLCLKGTSPVFDYRVELASGLSELEKIIYDI